MPLPWIPSLGSNPVPAHGELALRDTLGLWLGVPILAPPRCPHPPPGADGARSPPPSALPAGTPTRWGKSHSCGSSWGGKGRFGQQDLFVRHWDLLPTPWLLLRAPGQLLSSQLLSPCLLLPASPQQPHSGSPRIPPGFISTLGIPWGPSQLHPLQQLPSHLGRMSCESQAAGPDSILILIPHGSVLQKRCQFGVFLILSSTPGLFTPHWAVIRAGTDGEDLCSGSFGHCWIITGG